MDIEEQFFKHFCDVSDTLMLVLDTQGNVANANQFTCQLLQVNMVDMIGLNWFDHFIPENIRDSLKEAFTCLIEDNVAFAEYFENEILDKTGNHFFIRWHNKTVFDEQGKIQFIVASGLDITELKDTQNQLKQTQLAFDALNK